MANSYSLTSVSNRKSPGMLESAEIGTYKAQNELSFSKRLSAIQQSKSSYPTTPDTVMSDPPIVISDGENLSRTAICDLLLGAAHHVPYASNVKLLSLANRINIQDIGDAITHSEKKSLLSDLYKIRMAIPDRKKNDVANAIRYLEKLIYSSLLSDKFEHCTEKYQHDILNLSKPGTSRIKNISTNTGVSGGVSLPHSNIAIKAGAKIGFTRTYITDSDDEGTIARSKEKKFNVTLNANAVFDVNEQISAKAGGELTAKKVTSVGFNYTGGASDYYREKLSHKMFSYKKHGIRDVLTTRKHTLLDHQWKAQNTQPLLQESWNALTGRKVVSKSPIPFQADLTPKSNKSLGYSASVNANVSALVNAGAKLQYDYTQNDIEVNLLKNIFTQIDEGSASAEHIESLHAVSEQYAKVFDAVFNNSIYLKGKSYDSTLSNDDIRHAVNSLSKTLDEYTQCVQKYSAGHSSEASRKHAFEDAWGVRESGRYGFLQGAEIMLATLASRLSVDEGPGNQNDDIPEMMRELNSKIIHPDFTYDDRKLKPLMSFSNLLSIKNYSHTLTAEAYANIGHTVRGGGKITIALVNKHNDHPNRIRAGEQRDIEITLNGNVTLSDLTSKLTEDFANEAGIALSDLHSTLANVFDSTVDCSGGLKIIIRYLSSEWSSNTKDKLNYVHQATYVQNLKNYNLSLNSNILLAPIGIDISIGGGENLTNVIAQKMGTDTLNYLMLRYNYVKDKNDEQLAWEQFVSANKKNLLQLMKNIIEPGTNSNHETTILINEKIAKTPEPDQNTIHDMFTSIKQDFISAQQDAKNFDKALLGLMTLMDWHKETTDKLVNLTLKANGIAKPKQNTLQKAVSTFRK